MTTSTTVEEYLASLSEAQRQIADKLLPLIEQVLPGTGAMWHGHPVWSLGDKPGKSPVCLLKAYSSYVTFGLWRGQQVNDPSGRLEAGARTMATVKLRTPDDIDGDLFTDWLHQARALEQPDKPDNG
ncbi:hypothetical protein SAMN04489712_110132 [Thermomonospora echinospora]|uniref:YdhG-like domain-containing protein n=1 Tax=Thermomonospora echinospora TaxID=1992 RepID=A0A1H6CKT4_9ACTN|nr:DUF1801 domain-containing protein [Thermomonospora echinospora]SEG73614.1 hypothetical protein SAMN04489712_110132 [Thermomonospora echinospora]